MHLREPKSGPRGESVVQNPTLSRHSLEGLVDRDRSGLSFELSWFAPHCNEPGSSIGELGDDFANSWPLDLGYGELSGSDEQS